MVKLLLASGADADIKTYDDDSGRTPLDLAARKSYWEIAGLLRNHARSEWGPGSTVLEEFVVERTLGEGGMGKVYLVRAVSSGTPLAVKRAKGLNEINRRDFLSELQTWIDLPEHPNLVPCRFFRTSGNEVLVFADYVEGGSLKEWIDSRRLYAGDTWDALERILDTAIQFAWGLHCVHQRGLVHQDVKPGNVLMSIDPGPARQRVTPRITDYGLARASLTFAKSRASSSPPRRQARA